MSIRIVEAAVLLGLLTGLAACMGDPAAEQARLDAIDNQNCIDLGFKPQTEAYGNCRLKLKQIRAQQEANAARSSGIQFGVGLGVSKGF
ncbi:MAG: hypothetical protein V4441_06985 [Pseudomonadota bacterium]